MSKNKAITQDGQPSAQPKLYQRGPGLQHYGTVTNLPIGLDEKVRIKSCEQLNQILADTIHLRDLYKKHHWQVSGHTFYQLHLLFDKHYEEQAELVDSIAERIMSLGGISIAMAQHVAELTQLESPPKDREEVPVQISRLLVAHETILKYMRKAARDAADRGDDGTNDFIISDLIRTHELQVWFLAEHLVDTPLVTAE